MVSYVVADSSQSQNEVVDRVYRRSNLVATYSSVKLLPPESTALIRYRNDFVNRRVLELGCGAGRLAVYLSPIVAQYTGLDISSFMIDHCRCEFFNETFVEGDMRDLSRFASSSFDSILAVSNLFDAVSHSDRLRILSEMRRVLVTGGLLFFSAHNRNYINAGHGPQLKRHRNPITQFRQLLDYWQASRRHRGMKPQQRHEAEYALLNDSGNNYASLHYYIRRDVQLQQLATTGYVPLECLDSLGRSLTAESDDSNFPSIHYVARKE